MPKSAGEVTILGETARMVGENFRDIGDVWRHEALKKSAEYLLYLAGGRRIGRSVLRLFANGLTLVEDSKLETTFAGMKLRGPTGLAAGWDKTGKTILAWQLLGASHATIGGITLYGQSGRQMPRLRTFDNKVGDSGKSRSLNSYGFPGPRAETVARNIARQLDTGLVEIPVITQVTVNKEMYEAANRHLIPGVVAATVGKLKPVSNAIELGFSSFNTPGMRNAQDDEEFTLSVIMAAKEAASDGIPLGYKGDGDGGERRLDMYCRLAERTGLDFLSLINTTGLKHMKAKYGAAGLPGGLGGADPEYQQMALDAVGYAFDAVGDRTDIMGMGGINGPEPAVKMLRAGARAIGVNTAVRQLGANVMGLIDTGIADYLDVRQLDRIIGLDSKRGLSA